MDDVLTNSEFDKIEQELIQLHLATKPKARPNVNFTQGIVYMPQDYEDWRQDMLREFVARGLTKGPSLTMPLRLDVNFGRDFTEFQLYPSPIERPTGIRGDIDNLLGGFMETLQDAGIIVNDSQITQIRSQLWKDTDD